MLRLSIYILAVASLFFIGCNGGAKSGQHGNNVTPVNDTINTESDPQKVSYNVYIDNSGSMDGYMSQDSHFKDVLIRFISDIQSNLSITPKLSFINNNICEQKLDSRSPTWNYFIENLKPGNSKLNCPPGKETHIDKIIDLSTNSMGSNISIVISDCIFSNPGVSLLVAEADLKIFIARKLDLLNLSTVVLKYNSNFSGPYYMESKGGKGVPLSGANRPYYILLFGKGNSLHDLLSKINVKYPGFEASYCLLSGQRDKKIDAEVTYQNKIGAFSFEKPASKMIINDATPNNEKVFQFSINIDLSKISFEESYLLEPSNYSVNDNFRVVAVSKSTEPSNYNITLSTTDLKQSSDLELGLKYDIPKWVEKTGSEMDDDPTDSLQQKQTFGFKSLMQGISLAYKAKNGEQQFSIPIKVSKDNYDSQGSHKPFPWWIIIALFAIVGIFIWLKNKK